MSNQIGLPSRIIWIFIIFFIVLILGAGVKMFLDFRKGSAINSYEECVKAGNPIMDSYPEQCQTNKKIFINTERVIH